MSYPLGFLLAVGTPLRLALYPLLKALQQDKNVTIFEAMKGVVETGCGHVP